MKRAWAERAKQGGHSNGVIKSCVSATEQPPSKISKVEYSKTPPNGDSTQLQPRQQPQQLRGPPETHSSVDTVGAPHRKNVTSSPSFPASSLSPKPPVRRQNTDNRISRSGSTQTSQTVRTPVRRSTPSSPVPSGSVPSSDVKKRTKGSLKRQRARSSPAPSGDGKTSDNDSDSDQPKKSFYLKHQNSALASELKQLQYKVRLLEEERDYRRRQCEEAEAVLQTLEATWTKMEYALQLRAQRNRDEVGDMSRHTAGQNGTGAPRSTGHGESVERIGSLLNSLVALGKERIAHVSSETDIAATKGMAQTAKMISQRALTLQKLIWTMLSNPTIDDGSPSSPSSLLSAVSVTKLAELHGEVTALQSKIRDYEERITELAKSRDEAVESDRKVRRGLYRLSAGRMKLDEVMKAVEESSKDGFDAMLALEETTAIVSTKPVNDAIGSSTQGKNKGGNSDISVKSDDGNSNDKDDGMTTEHTRQLRKEKQDLEEIAKSRQEEIRKLREELSEREKRINTLSMPTKGKEGQLAESDVKGSKWYTECSSQRSDAEKKLKDVEAKLKDTRERWAVAKGEADRANQNIEELVQKYKKRWADVVTTDTDRKEANGAGLPLELTAATKRIAELENKLVQALENVRQAGNVRKSLSEALALNEILQSKVDELRSKGGGKTSSSSTSSGKSSPVPDGGNSHSSSGRSGSSTSSHGEGKTEKIYKENKRIRKELAAALASKEAAKGKLERAEREKESLLKSNARLLKQSAEKDDINARSLSTVLHLKELTEQLKLEKEAASLETKTGKQMNVALRLADNAKDRVAEVMANEREEMEGKVGSLEVSCERLQTEKDKAMQQISLKEIELAQIAGRTSNLKSRCDELVAELSTKMEEQQQLSEALDVARREIAVAKQQAMAAAASQTGLTGLASSSATALLSSSSSGPSSEGFTAEQLSKQVTVLKGRLACPVCCHRDKKCILLRCRHMFCRQCIDENIRNRSRKCPACQTRFDTKDVQDIWL